jgi:hypothetical protein
MRLCALILLVACKPAEVRSPDLAAARVTCSAAADCSGKCTSEKLDECVATCAARVPPEARPYWDALQNCSKTNCKDSCASPSFSCKFCVTSHCASEVSGCLSH